jgi:hypothetical protein
LDFFIVSRTRIRDFDVDYWGSKFSKFLESNDYIGKGAIAIVFDFLCRFNRFGTNDGTMLGSDGFRKLKQDGSERFLRLKLFSSFVPKRLNLHKKSKTIAIAPLPM